MIRGCLVKSWGGDSLVVASNRCGSCECKCLCRVFLGILQSSMRWFCAASSPTVYDSLLLDLVLNAFSCDVHEFQLLLTYLCGLPLLTQISRASNTAFGES